MNKTQKILTTILWGLLVLVMVGVVAGRHWLPQRPAPAGDQQPLILLDSHRATDGLPILYSAPAFSLVDQNEQPLASEDLFGRPWVAAFIFTRCAGPCQDMTAQMAKLQDALDDLEVKLISFSLDPDHDTPKVLRDFAEAYGADHARWHFLTGNRPEILEIAAGMRLTALPTEGDIIHSEQFVLIDAAGQIRGYYSGRDDAQLARLAKDIEQLSEDEQ